jgi:hypothetical protein
MNTGLNFPSGNPLDPSGNLTPQWRMFFLTLFTRSGGTAGSDTATLQAAITKANANIADLQSEDAQGEPAPDMAAVFGLIHVVEAIAAQAMAAASRQSDERGETGESASVTHLSQRVAEIEGQIEHYRADDALRQRIADLESRIESMQPVIADASQLTGLGTMATQDASAVAVSGGSINNVAAGATTPLQGITNTGLYTGQRFGSSGAFVLRSAAGTQAVPAQISAATQIALIVMRAYNDVGSYGDVSSLGVGTDGAVTSTSAPGYLTINTTASGATSVTERARVTSAGLFLIGRTADDGSGNKLQVNGGLSIVPVTTTTAPAAGAAGALPATPTGYATIRIGGTDRKIAYY